MYVFLCLALPSYAASVLDLSALFYSYLSSSLISLRLATIVE